MQVVGLANDQTNKILIGALSIGATLVAQTAAGQPKLAGTDIAFGSVPVLRVGCWPYVWLSLMDLMPAWVETGLLRLSALLLQVMKFSASRAFSAPHLPLVIMLCRAC